MTAKRQRPLVLLADDEDEIRKVLAHILGTLSDPVDTIQASNGQEAIDQIKDHSPDLILLDLIMPYMDGYTVLDDLKARQIDNWSPVAVLTGYGDKHLEADLFRFGADAYLEKPVMPMKLKATIHALLRSKARYDDLKRRIDTGREALDRFITALDKRLDPTKVDEALREANLSR